VREFLAVDVLINQSQSFRRKLAFSLPTSLLEACEAQADVSHGQAAIRIRFVAISYTIHQLLGVDTFGQHTFHRESSV